MTATTTGAMDLWKTQGGMAAWSSGPPPVNANVPWAAEVGREMAALIKRQARRAPRSTQLNLGPSELGVDCDYQVVGKMVGQGVAPHTNNVSDPWPAIIGTAVHAWLATALTDENARIGVERFLAELRVAPIPEHPGTTDWYDAVARLIGDWKVVGPTTLAKISSPSGPPRKYKVQLLLYYLGCLIAGYDAHRVVLIALPRAAPTLDQMYVWGCEPGPEEFALLAEVIRVTAVRRQIAALILQGVMHLNEVPITPDPDECFFRPCAPSTDRSLREMAATAAPEFPVRFVLRSIQDCDTVLLQSHPH
jgi:hypothetical protein